MREGGPRARQPRPTEAGDGTGHLPLRFDRRRAKPTTRRWRQTRRASDVQEIAALIDLWEARKRLRSLAYLALLVTEIL